MINRFTRLIALLAMHMLPAFAFAQCLMYPVSFDERVNAAQSLLIGRVTTQYCYADNKGNIFTSSKIVVEAWIKNHSSATEVYVITPGGVLNGQAQITYPAARLQEGKEYFLLLENDNLIADDKALRASQPGMIQAFPFSDAQGAWLYQDGKYHDVFTEAITEADLLQKLLFIAGLQAKKPDGTAYTPKIVAGRTGQAADITSFSPNPTNAGTVNPADYLTINGSGFGTSPGTVEFRNADDGGATYITPPTSTDYVSWSDNQIVVKVPTGSGANAGTGTFRVNGTFLSPQPLTINYSHISIVNTFSGFLVATRQRYYLRNLDGLGGYTFVYNTNFASNTAAVASFERALNTWRCNTGINWRASGTTGNGYADDGVNVVLFDATLPSGVLARATSRFSGSAITGTCDQQNTVWWLKEIDVQARETGVNWQFGPALATGSQYDFETVLLHELGHAHGLGHRIAPGQLMNYALSNATNIRTPAAVEIQGAQNKMTYSTAPTCFDPTGSGTPMIAASCAFPVKLISFTGELKKYGTELNWRTQNEINSDRFEVQRSINGRDFNFIGTVRAKGNPVIETSYLFTDANVQQGMNYYRLKMIDKDGSFEYSAVIAIKVTKRISTLAVYPNPVKNELKVSSTVKTTLDLIDADGKLVKRMQAGIGVNRADVSGISNGIYYLYDKDSGTKLRVMIMH